MDATIVAICRPSHNQRIAYNGYYRTHAMKFGCIITPDGIISHCSPPFEGRKGDGAIVVDSGIVPLLSEHAHDAAGRRLVVYGDPAYGENELIVSGLKQLETLTSQEQDFNREMSRYRQSVEWGFGKVRLYFNLALV